MTVTSDVRDAYAVFGGELKPLGFAQDIRDGISYTR
jgi:hypothetical protein